MARLIDGDEFIKEMNNRCEEAIKWGINAIADHNEEIKIRAEQAVATFCEASLAAKKMPTIEAELVRHAKIINIPFGNSTYEGCSLCGADYNRYYSHGNYCSYCGAKFEEVNDEN